MFDAVRALIPFIFRTLGLHRIEAACLPDNEASKSLLIKAGFGQEGTRATISPDQWRVAGSRPICFARR
jgi:RimJ/RimL family protein N-acetyltransferase